MSIDEPRESPTQRQAFPLPSWELSLLTACERLLELMPERARTDSQERAAELFPVLALFYRATNTYQANLSLAAKASASKR